MVELPPGGVERPDVSEAALQQRIRQQELLADLGVQALQGVPFGELLDRTAQAVAEGLQAEFAKVLEHQPDAGCFLVRAGVGWPAGVVGSATVGADGESPAGFALRTGRPVISNHLNDEARFRTPSLMLENGIRRAMNVILAGDGRPFGVLEVDSRTTGEFNEQDLTFLQGAANLLGMAIERQRIERELREAVAGRELLLQEVNHRVKNSLQLVASMLQLQGNAASGEVRGELLDASTRVAAVARAHQRLYRSHEVGTLDLSAYLVDLCADLAGVRADCRIEVDAGERVEIATDRAIPVALVVNELVTNAVKYAHPGSGACHVQVRLARAGAGTVRLSVRDDGKGLPEGFDPAGGGGLGMRIVTAFAQQLGAELTVGARHPGSEFALLIPLRPDGPPVSPASPGGRA